MNTETTRQLEIAEHTVDDLLAAIDDGKRELAMVGIVPCICCRKPFQSQGRHNVVCGPCRATAPEF